MSRYVDEFVPRIKEMAEEIRQKIDGSAETSHAIRTAPPVNMVNRDDLLKISTLLKEVVKVEQQGGVKFIGFYDPYLNVRSFMIQMNVTQDPEVFVNAFRNWMMIVMKMSAGRLIE